MNMNLLLVNYFLKLIVFTFQELIQGMISVTHNQHRCFAFLPKILIAQQSLSDLEPHVGFP